MSTTELTKRYPKFYPSEGGKPHLWLGAIEVECVKDYVHYSDDDIDGYNYKAGQKHKFDFPFYSEHRIDIIGGNFNPKFKPQEGDEFILDLAKAVTIACTKPNEHENMVHHASVDKYHTFRSTYNPAVRFFVQRDNIAWARWRNGNIGLEFDTVAYTDTIRGLGYYA